MRHTHTEIESYKIAIIHNGILVTYCIPPGTTREVALSYAIRCAKPRFIPCQFRPPKSNAKTLAPGKRSGDWQVSQDSHYWCKRRLCKACGPEGIPRKATYEPASEVKVFCVALVLRRPFFDDCKAIRCWPTKARPSKVKTPFLAPKPDWSRRQHPLSNLSCPLPNFLQVAYETHGE